MLDRRRRVVRGFVLVLMVWFGWFGVWRFARTSVGGEVRWGGGVGAAVGGLILQI